MENDLVFFTDLQAEAQVPPSGMVRRTLYDDDHVKTIVFGFAPGHELAPHAAPMAASLYFVSGEAELRLGEERHEARAGTFVHMPPRLLHGIVAKSAVVMILQMYKQDR